MPRSKRFLVILKAVRNRDPEWPVFCERVSSIEQGRRLILLEAGAILGGRRLSSI